MKNFVLIGAAGYIAPRHMQAIKETGNNLSVAYDPKDSVGILDSYFLDTDFFTEFERLDRHVEKLRRGKNENKIDFVSICSPNYLHDAHIRFALRIGANAICEKPIVLNPWNIDVLQLLEKEYNKKVYTILQLRLHPSIIGLKEKYKSTNYKHKIKLNYITTRGKRYMQSWKGNLEKSGGLVTNIGIHFFDMLMWIFGDVKENILYTQGSTKSSGFIELENAEVERNLSIDHDDLPNIIKEKGQTTFRSITIDGEEIEFSSGFKDLHTLTYEDILSGRGFGLEDAKPSIKLVHEIRNMKPVK